MALPDDVIALRRIRGAIKTSFTATKTWLNNESLNKSPAELKRRNQHLASKFDEFTRVQNKIFAVDENESDEYFVGMEVLYFEIASKIDELLELSAAETKSEAGSYQSEDVGDNQSATFHIGKSNIKLSKLPLPEFSGKPEEWTSFHQRFSNAVDRPELSDIERIQYLASCIKGEAALTIKNIAMTGENYTIAIDLLKKRYDNKRLNLRLYLNNLYNLPSVVSNNVLTLRVMLNTTIVNVRALENLDYQRDLLSNELLAQLIVTKLDAKTRESWEMQLTTLDAASDNDRDAYSELIEFLEDRLRVLTSVYPTTAISTPSKDSPKLRNTKTVLAVTANPNKADRPLRTCALCKKPHSLYACPEFKKLTIPDRYAQVKSWKLCMNCFGRKHWATQCTSSTCKLCGGLHHTLLHREDALAATINATSSAPTESASPAAITPLSKEEAKSVVTAIAQQQPRDVLLATAIVNVVSMSGITHRAVALIDGASHASFVTKRLQELIQSPLTETKTIIHGFGGKSSQTAATTKFQITSASVDHWFELVAIVSNTITDLLPSQSFDLTSAWSFLNDYELADPTFNQKKEIDILIGADILYDILQPEFHRRENTPTLQASALGWLVVGPYAALTLQPQVHCTLTRTEFTRIIDFWELEDPPSNLSLTAHSASCEQHFRDTYSRINGRFQVRLPFQDSRRPAASRQQALARFKRMTFTQKYREFMHEYEILGHMKLVKSDQLETEAYYIPHHAVEREDKLRVVFDASMKSSNNLSLNDCLQVGPTIQPTIFETLLRFRTYEFVFTADISKMYRQISMHDDDQRWQRIFWFNNDEIAEFELTTVTYGTASAPFAAIRCLFQLAEDGRQNYPRAASILEGNCYVDDILTGSNSLEEAVKCRIELCDLLATAGMQLSKWRANHPSLLPSNQSNNATTPIANVTGKTLGIEWNSNDDTLCFPAYSMTLRTKLTKRTALSILTKVFDPLGLLAPITVTGKLLIQELWTQNVAWDEPVSAEFNSRFNKFLTALHSASSFTFPRYIGGNESSPIELHAFADASARAYATCIYVRYEHPDCNVEVTLLCARTRVAPIRTPRTIPELELCAAALLIETLEPVAKVMNCPLENCYAYSDSTVVLSYLARDYSHWKPFVANRVRKITSVLASHKWRHITGESNPADIATRAKAATEFKSRFKLWASGPDILRTTTDEANFSNWVEDESTHAYLRSSKTALSIIVKTESEANWRETLIQRFSSYLRLIRTIAFMRRIKYRNIGTVISPNEFRAAEVIILQWAQADSFPAELNDKQLVNLMPFLHNGLLRVGGRLEHADLSFDQRHPIVLAAKHRITKLIIRDIHWRYFHAGTRFVTYILKLRFWFVGSLEREIKKCIQTCARCIRHGRQRPMAPVMGNLPETRVRSTYPFDIVGTDFAGPLIIRQAARSKMHVKAYVAIFICFASKAVHLETVSDLSTPAFLAALKRFTARRGYPSVICSDNGTNFVGGEAELQRQMEILARNETVQNFMSLNSVEWQFNPPASPHMGGIWESAVRITKFHLYRVTNTHALNFEELTTLLCQIEAIMNSRPITPLRQSNVPFALTPGHFLIGRPLISVPDATRDGTRLNLVKRWTLLSQLRANFWRGWQRDYLSTLQKRVKWYTRSPSLKIGDIVLITNETTPPLVWPLARVVQTYPGRDGTIRVVELITGNGAILRRPVTKLIPLVDAEINDD